MTATTMNKIMNWRITRTETALIAEIAERARRDLPALGGTKLDLVMDLTAVHANGCRLRLQALLDAPPFDFKHDIVGIRRHIDRNTGQLLDCFLPRFSEPVHGGRA